MPEDLRVTGPLLKTIEAFLVEPTGKFWGFDLMKATGLGSGTLYPLLARLESLGWLDSGWSEPSEPGKPARRYYQLTTSGVENARITRAGAKLRGRHVGLRKRPQPELGSA